MLLFCNSLNLSYMLLLSNSSLNYEILWKAVQRVFPGFENWSCSYHKIQEDMRRFHNKIRFKDKEHLVIEYRTDPEIRRVMQLTLSLLPIPL